MGGRFDWYQATCKAEVGPLLAVLAGASSEAGVASEPMQRAPHGYRFGQRLSDSQGLVCQVWWGGCHQLPHVVSSGESAQSVAEVLRAEVDHWVSRADACLDFAEPDAFERLQGISLGVAEQFRVKVNTAGDHLLTMQGRTVYLGAPTSHTRLRLYEKADELRAKFRADPARLATVPDHLARLECQVRPQTPQAKAEAAVCSPMALMGSARWMRELMRLVSGIGLEPFEAGRGWRQADDERSYAALLAQYGGLLGRICGDLGSWDMVGRQMGQDLADRAQAKRQGPR
jgi:hypothetical protein